MKGLALSLNLRFLCSSVFASSFEFYFSILSISLLDVLYGWSLSCHCFRDLLWGLPRVADQDAVAMSLVECWSFFSINFGYISGPLPKVNISITFPTHISNTLAVCEVRLGLAKKLSKHRLHFFQLFLFVAWRFSYLVQMLCCWLWTGSCLGEHSGFWFRSGKRLDQSRYLRVRSSASNQLWFLYYRLWIGFRHHICTFYFLGHAQSSAFYPAQRLRWRHYIVVPYVLLFGSYLSTLFYHLFISRMAVESFY